MTKDDIYQKIADSSLFGNLGLFIGAGFSKAVFEGNPDFQPLSWIQLLEKISLKNNIDWDCIEKSYRSCPEIASALCVKIAENHNISIRESEEKLKEQISNITSWYPNQDNRNSFGIQLSNLNPKWIITTNYDLVIEGLLPDITNSLGPFDSFVFSDFSIPIYHMHGIRTIPNSLIITNEDYIKLFRPSEYRIHKLSLIINESTTLLIGYGVGDQNVLTALDWSKNVYKNNKAHYPNGVIQLVFCQNPKDFPVETSSGIILIETNSILETLSSINDKINANKAKHNDRIEEIKQITSHLVNADEKIIVKFITQSDYRLAYIVRISDDYRYIIQSFLNFLAKVFDCCWKRAIPYGAFQAYEEMTSIVLDVLIEISYEKMPPALFETVAYNLDRFSTYIGPGKGESHAAFRLWNSKKDQISEVTKRELINYANQCDSKRITRLF